MRKVFVLFALVIPLGALFASGGGGDNDPSTIEDWCPSNLQQFVPEGCIAQLPVWTCHTAGTQPWCCVRKAITYNCDDRYVDTFQQWNKANAHCAADQKSCVDN